MRQYYISFSRFSANTEIIHQVFIRANNVQEAFMACGICSQSGVTTDKVLLVYSEAC